MKTLARTFSYISLLAGLLIYFTPRGGKRRAFFWGPHLLAVALSPITAILGWAGALLGISRRDPAAIAGGIAGSGLASAHIRSTLRVDSEFNRAFGQGWESRLPPDLRRSLALRRWPGLVPPAVKPALNAGLVDCPETGKTLKADIWKPAAGVPPSGLAVLFFHSSAWHYLDKGFFNHYLFRRLAGQGHLILDVGYSLAPEASFREMLAETYRAVALMKENAAEYGVDPNRLVLMGGSAGGQLAMLAAHASDDARLRPAGLEADTRVRGVIAFYAPVDLPSMAGYVDRTYARLTVGSLPPVEKAFTRAWEKLVGKPFYPPKQWLPNVMGGSPEEKLEEYRLTSPLNHIRPDCPPTLLLQGTQDLAGTQPDMRRFARTLRDAGASVAYIEYPNADHMFDLMLPFLSPAAQSATYDVERFLALMKVWE